VVDDRCFVPFGFAPIGTGARSEAPAGTATRSSPARSTSA